MKKGVNYLFVFSLLIWILLFNACGSSSNQQNTDSTTENLPIRDSTPDVLLPVAEQSVVYSGDGGCIDASHTEEGYLMAIYTGTSAKAKLQITGSNGITYTYNMHDSYEAFPLTSGDGNYQVKLFENVSGDSYSTLLAEDISVTITNEFGPYLYANQYVNFTKDSLAVAKASELANNLHSDLEVVTSVYDFITETITYDTQKAKNVASDYIPDIDAVLQSKTGICFDYASLMTAMLRSQGIPTRMEWGYAKDVYHSWISVHISDIGWVNGIIEFDGQQWKLMDPTFAASNNSSKEVKSFVGDGSNYTTQYIY